MRLLILALMLLSLGACAATPEAPAGPPASPGATLSPRPGPAAEVTVEEPGLRVRLRNDGQMRVDREGAAEEWSLPAEAAEKVMDTFRSSGFFGPASRPSETGGTLAVGLREGDLHQVRAPRTPTPELRALARVLEDLVPGQQGVGPDSAWIAGTLIYEDLEGGLWKIQTGPQQHFVLATPPPGFQSGERVRATGRPAPSDTMGIHMAGPTYEVLTLRRVAGAASPVQPRP